MICVVLLLTFMVILNKLLWYFICNFCGVLFVTFVVKYYL